MSNHKRNNEVLSISDVLKELVAKSKLKKGLDAQEVKQVWKDIMGKNINAYTKEIILKNGVLYVWLTSSALREELLYGKQKIIQMINEKINEQIVMNLIFR